VQAHDSLGSGFSLEINKFADLSEKEIQSMLGLKPPAQKETQTKFLGEEESSQKKCQCKCEGCLNGTGCVNNEDGKSDEASKGGNGRRLQEDFPKSLDWRASGAVNSVRNQANCGGCYAFVTTATIEAAYKIKYGTLPELSNQQIIDCSYA
jgi:C1A family cysteine protease